MSVNVTLSLPDELVERAEAAGLLTSAQFSAWIEMALTRHDELERLRADLTRLRAAAEPLGEAEVNALVSAEIKAYRAEKRAKQSE
jgi:post-segregation antitoxin (ccd killing protein)